MELDRQSRMVQIGVQLYAIFINLFLILGFYTAQYMFRHSGIAKNRLTHLSEYTFALGIVGLIATIIGARKASVTTRWMLLALTTMLNQACLIAYVISTQPFRLASF